MYGVKRNSYLLYKGCSNEMKLFYRRVKIFYHRVKSILPASIWSPSEARALMKLVKYFSQDGKIFFYDSRDGKKNFFGHFFVIDTLTVNTVL